ncbi:MAG: hypothetical protein ACT4PI_15135 [Actinomycetota bacterium]
MPQTEKDLDLREENLRLREEILELRDALVGTEAQLAEALGRLRILEDEVLRHQVLARMMSSRTGRLLQSYNRLRTRLRERG